MFSKTEKALIPVGRQNASSKQKKTSNASFTFLSFLGIKTEETILGSFSVSVVIVDVSPE
ncbi:hypothetical protein [Parasutterella excrementihominis]|uniref:hypothetical protein n=1 Tax=Parasutterella excrementihominis TaxID=487175 RepID=UPI001F4F2937|nr:hypothetical protein [Parasutterella excrementihominis]